MKFDKVIGNPPYEGRSYLYLKILYITKANAKDVAWLCPTTFVDDIYKRNSTYNSALHSICKKLDKFEDVDPTGFDMQVAQESLGIFYFSDECTEPMDSWNLAWRKFEDPNAIKKIIENLKNYCQDNNLYDSILSPKKIIGTKAMPDPAFKCNPDKWYIGTSWVRGTINDWTWVTLLGDKDVPKKGEVRDSWFHVWEFDTEEKALQFADFLTKSDVFKFAVAMEKKNQTNNRGDFKFFPNTELPWDEDTLVKKIGLDKKNLDLVKKILEKYKKVRDN